VTCQRHKYSTEEASGPCSASTIEMCAARNTVLGGIPSWTDHQRELTKVTDSLCVPSVSAGNLAASPVPGTVSQRLRTQLGMSLTNPLAMAGGGGGGGGGWERLAPGEGSWRGDLGGMQSSSDAGGGAAPSKCSVVPLQVRPTPCKFQMAVRPVAHNCSPLSRPFHLSKRSTLHQSCHRITHPVIPKPTAHSQCSLLLAKNTYFLWKLLFKRLSCLPLYLASRLLSKLSTAPCCACSTTISTRLVPTPKWCIQSIIIAQDW
jgi:hypothetical protein